MRSDKVFWCLLAVAGIVSSTWGKGVLVSASSHVAAPLFLPPEVSGDPVEYRRYSRARGWRIGPGRCK